MEQTKICQNCKKEKPATQDYFHISKSNRDGLKHKCKPCAVKQVSEARKRTKTIYCGDFYVPDAGDYRDDELYKTQLQLVEKFIKRRMRVGDIVRQYPETRKHIHGILGILEFEHKIRFTDHVLIPHVEPVPPRERELELARRRANQETVQANCGNSMLFVKSTAEREIYAELGLAE